MFHNRLLFETLYDKSLLTKVAQTILSLGMEFSKTILFQGELAAGKTTLIIEMSRLLGHRDIVQSPTFSIANEYHGTYDKIIHMDLYRIEHQDELLMLGFEEYLHKDNWVFIEWFDLALDYIDKPYILVVLSHISESLRKIQVYEIAS
ncbi:MAG: tRNA (adenosine(37)-N6)-threonylcarbamoyltransferase complex ATPase subunit type 1 TsaE [Chitinophagales bacterium]|jgi:tRNA threonylcarbamoyladenosine biosynthesis protein TsaE|nr:tRNA (adenosine(37)-N6)-threonylcarbamoyltransferase complex ATPase subunit type 1 TsaE [Chitinophagales bacterium]